MTSGTVVVAVGVSFLVTLALVPVLVRFAIGRNLLDVPNARSSHEIPTPRLGGLAVIAGVWAAAPFMSGGFLVLIVATLAGLVGAFDDFVDLRFWMKAAGQTAAAFVLLFLAPPPICEAAGPLWPGALFLGVFWIVAVMNAYNFMDGIDGIAGGTAILNALFLATLVGASGLGVGLAALASAAGGFILWNLSPARIFLGDSGSHFIGFFLGAVTLYTEPIGETGSAYSPYLAFVVAAAVFTPFLFDTAFTLVRRTIARKNVFSAHREHVYQRITPDPARHRQVSNIYFALSAFCGLAVLLASGGTPLRLLVGAASIFGCCLFMVFLPRLAGERDYAR
ncbi:MAG: Undecaprenyl-phosphate alpha-N-acetylglucosaminyl 1-phosphate transferase [uncultured Rubrobacteraceae bacterium]|uniref:Undecaprenyl-phosphate alpha-N-acetylglucosaminyl 1-phosphate transferase n=1 Tax=uncultured Rubrobacteraceae bacterium TaxID=349277 RepID=A0A6J4QPR3_9ACTN|nr:MAG: Undecaprenyl-phosphate alpha-N-acetylglucosaminyl 1-phosphate transferase [uncultured Rubrobacteraceae bacterium]